MTADLAGCRAVRVQELRVGDLLAEGGEGRVYELPLQPHLVFKAYRRPVPCQFVSDLVAWPASLAATQLLARLQASAGWPDTMVLSDAGEAAAGLLLPRAPRRFALRHRDGTTRLASLSYLTADPAHRAVAYGLRLPPEASAERIGLVYALARLLEAFESADPRVGHGDLSTKNVLWSMQRGPEVFVIDCDNSERFGADGEPLGHHSRRRAMTPNWEDPAVTGGQNPTLASDRYSLALIFLRVVGAANFPIQARQREGPTVAVDFAVPAPLIHDRLLGPGAPLWDLCQRGLSVADSEERPPASVWVGALEALLDGIGAVEVIRSVWANQGGGRPSPVPAVATRAAPGDVLIRPVPRAAPRPEPRWTRISSETAFSGRLRTLAVGSPAGGSPLSGSGAGAAVGAGLGAAHLVSGSAANAGAVGAGVDPVVPVMPQIAAALRNAIRWWAGTHRRAVATLLSAGGRGKGLVSLAFCAAMDVVILLFGIFIAAMLVSPVLGI